MGNPPNGVTGDAAASGLALALPAAVIAQTFTAAIMFAPAVLAPAASVDIGVPATMVGVVTALIYLAAAMAAPAAGARVPRVGAVRMTQFGLLLAGAGLALTVLAHPLAVIIDALRLLIAHAELRRISFTAFLFGGVQLSFASFLVVFLVERAEFSMVRAGTVLSVAMLAGMVGRLLWGAAADYFGSARGVLIALGGVTACCAAGMTQVTAHWPYAAILVLAIVFGATTLGWNGVYIGELARVAPPGKVAIATGASLAFAYSGAVVVAPLFALVLALTGSYVIGFSMLAGLAAAGVASLLYRR